MLLSLIAQAVSIDTTKPTLTSLGALTLPHAFTLTGGSEGVWISQIAADLSDENGGHRDENIGYRGEAHLLAGGWPDASEDIGQALNGVRHVA